MSAAEKQPLAQPPKAIIFDWDNTLVDTEITVFKALNATFERFGKETVAFEDFKKQPSTSIHDCFTKFFGKHAQEAIQYFLRYTEEIHLEEIKFISGTKETLEFLKDAPVHTAVVSNKLGPLLRKETKHLGVCDYFHAIVGSKDADSDKPTLAPVEKALEKTGIHMGPDVWFVGDSCVDMECAKNGGFTPFFRGCDITAANQNVHDPTISKVGDLHDFNRILENYLKF